MTDQNNVTQPAIVVTLTRTLGAYGAAFDLPGPHRAFTYHHQPGNIGAHRLGAAWQEAASGSSGDLIDRGLGLLKALQGVGFGVFEVSETAAPADEKNVLCCDAVMDFRRSDAAFPAQPLPVFSAGKWTYDGTGQSFDYKDLDEAAFSVYRAALASAPNAIPTEDSIRWQAGAWEMTLTEVMVDGRRWYRDDDPKVLASAPVAGEALGFVAAAALETNFYHPDARIDMFKTDLGLLGYYHTATPVAVYAAPQASALAAEYTRGRTDGFDAARNAALEEAAKLMDQTLRSSGAALIRGLKRPRADEDAACLHPRAYRAVDRNGYACPDCGVFVSKVDIYRSRAERRSSATKTGQGERDA